MVRYQYIDTVKIAIAAAHACLPRLQETAILEFGELVSLEVQRGDWTPVDGVPINTAGKNPEDYLRHCIAERTSKEGLCHWFIPEIVVEAADRTWLDGSLTAQGARWRAINAVLNDPAATDEAMRAEAAKYGVVPGSTKIGTKPGTKPPDGARTVASASNPWGQAYVDRNGIDKAYVERARLMKTLNLKACAALAAAAGRTITGAVLK